MSDFINLLKKNDNLLNKAIMLDNDKWGFNKNIDNIINNEINDIKLENNKNYLVIYEGDIEYTTKICDESIKTGSNVIFILNDEYLATNKSIIRIANEFLKNKKLKNFIKLYNNTEDKRVIKNSAEVDEVIFIGNAFDYRNIKDKIKSKCTFIETE